jgi:hypothetical protein
MSRRKSREIRVDDTHAIKLKTSKWFPEMTLLAIVFAFFGLFFYGDILTTSSSFSVGGIEGINTAVYEKTVKKDVKKVKISPNLVVRQDVQPRIIGAETKMRNIKLELENTVVVGESATVTYRIYNTGRTPISGTTWAIGDSQNQAFNKQILPWQARTFTRKTTSFQLSSTGLGEFKIFVSDDLAKLTNSYTVRF